MSNSVNFSFLVCKDYHDTRTRPLVQYIKRVGPKYFSNFSYQLLSGFDTFDDISVKRVCDKDDYLSCIDKTLYIFKNTSNIYDWYFIGDDDTAINFKNLKSFIDSASTSSLAIYGNVWPCKNYIYHADMPHAHGGAGVLLNRRTLLTIQGHIRGEGLPIIQQPHSDVTLAMNVYDYNMHHEECISYIDNPLMHGSVTWGILPTMCSGHMKNCGIVPAHAFDLLAQIS